MSQNFVAIDLETTGADPASDEIIEVAAIRFQDGSAGETFSTLVRPTQALPPFIQALTGIAPQSLETAPPFSSALPTLVQFLGSWPVVGHRVGFDISFLRSHGLPLENPTYDTRELAAILLPRLGDYSLASLSRTLGLATRKPHRAQPDAQAAGEAFLKLVAKLQEVAPQLLSQMVGIIQGTGWPMAALLHEAARQRDIAPSRPDAVLGMSLLKTEEPRGELLRARSTAQPLDPEEVAAFFAPGGPLAHALPSYEHRPQQAEMAGAIAQVFGEGGRLLVEAGTGVGKSLAYLVPAALYAWRNDAPVVISTNTLNLQEQLKGQDIPLTAKALGLAPDRLRAATLKGRSNYLCLRRWALYTGLPPNPQEAGFLLRILAWMAVTETGDRAELNLEDGERRLWGNVCALGKEGQARQCPYREGLCFHQRAREKARRAHLVVVNHALLLADLASGGQAIPEHRHLIIDEAHNLEEEATQQFGFRLGERELLDYLERAKMGTLSPPSRQLPLAPGRPSARAGQLGPPLAELRSAVEHGRERAALFFAQLRAFLESYSPDEGGYERWLRLTRGLRAQPAWHNLEVSLENLRLSLQDMEANLGRLALALEDTVYRDFPHYLTLGDEASSLAQEAAELAQKLGEAAATEPGFIYWGSLAEGVASLHAAPHHVGPLLAKSLYSRLEALTLTSATLATEGSFAHIKERLGLEDAREMLLGSPFDYMASTLLLIPQDIPAPKQPGYSEAMAQALIATCQASQGRALALFTSHASLRQAREDMALALAAQDIQVVAQGLDGPPGYLLERLKAQPRTVLLGTSSFWEGVDVPGEALSLLVIARLPFAVPTEPVTAARSERYSDPFHQYALPQAILRFRQGFGRLIRRQGDRGVVLVLDRRLVSQAYGRAFLSSIPLCTVKKVRARDLAREVEGWLKA